MYTFQVIWVYVKHLVKNKPIFEAKDLLMALGCNIFPFF